MTLTCNRCGQTTGLDTPYRTWIATGRCRACLIGRSESNNECSWCLEEFQIEAKPGESHGICARHSDEMDSRIASRETREERC